MIIELENSIGFDLYSLSIAKLIELSGEEVYISADKIWNDFLEYNNFLKADKFDVERSGIVDVVKGREFRGVRKSYSISHKYGIETNNKFNLINPFSRNLLKVPSYNNDALRGRIGIVAKRTMTSAKICTGRNFDYKEIYDITGSSKVVNLQHHEPTKEKEQEVLEDIKEYFPDVYNVKENELWGMRILRGCSLMKVLSFYTAIPKTVEILGTTTWAKLALNATKDLDMTLLLAENSEASIIKSLVSEIDPMNSNIKFRQRPKNSPSCILS